MTVDWLARWEEGNTGWHEEKGNPFLRRWWDMPASARRVLVPLCGKSLDLAWLAAQGHDVVGVELSPVAVEAFFTENDLAFERQRSGELERFSAKDLSLEIFCGDYFSFNAGPFDALFDRGALVALGESIRPAYVAHTQSLLKPSAAQLLITLDYDQKKVEGPPFSVPDEEVEGYWPQLTVAETINAIDDLPPKFKEAGLSTVKETIWRSKG